MPAAAAAASATSSSGVADALCPIVCRDCGPNVGDVIEAGMAEDPGRGLGGFGAELEADPSDWTVEWAVGQSRGGGVSCRIRRRDDLGAVEGRGFEETTGMRYRDADCIDRLAMAAGSTGPSCQLNIKQEGERFRCM